MEDHTCIKVENLLKIDNIDNYKIHFAVGNGVERPLDVFVRDRDEWKEWNSWRGNNNRFSREYIFSVMRFHPQPEKWLFGGIFKVVERHKDGYVVTLEEQYQEYIGRLLIDYPGPKVPGSAFYLEKHYPNLLVSQIFEKPYSGDVFCGYENIEHGFLQLESIFKQNKRDWMAALKNVKGVYLIVDKHNGKMYVGSAYGETGIWSRWGCYIGTGHGWNDELTKLIKENGIDYARKNFQFSILEYRSMKTDDNVIIEREQYWKRVLLSGTFGYNKN
ncbi:GIY-YIG nuclease family protein [Methanococcoides seepicolus]|uniref:GIY-YIG nuclease family protein n=1 Tax=Methanococcoides seepicolus TaxID=2828780 RepID=A0A9E4ZH45_9EURY|nr:GIY-YIG nuclease family protein [Methanococcoides seepicolus]MCM1987068.1 GIY-YIG nuclease family protein [Methanococcoides seepicolus]